MNIRTLIVDDEPLAREGIRLLLQKETDISIVGECGNGMQAVQTIQTTEIDLLFLDIQMPEMDGFEVLSSIPQHRMPLVVFVTAYDQFALKAFKVHALNYLLKPYSDKEFFDVLHHAKEYLRLKSVEPLTNRLRELLQDISQPSPAQIADRTSHIEYLSRIAVTLKGNIIPIPVDEIIWFEAADYYVNIHTQTKSYLLRETLSNLEEKLDPNVFIRIHRSVMVRISAIKEIRPFFEGESFVLLHNGTKLKLGKTYKQKLKAFMHFPT
ncbi:MAG: response regulator transcription factor [Ignavibacteriae bacterium]|nr:response regulator transcription factor [Ignavibacteriota bacterium]